MTLFSHIPDYFSLLTTVNLVQALVFIVTGYLLARFVPAGVEKILIKISRKQHAHIISKLIKYIIIAVFAIAVLQQLGFQLTALLSAAGIITVALGFAAQTSVANIISGIFIIFEKPFTLGDTIIVNDLNGEVVSIDLLSIKLRTSNNTLVRIPNDSLLKQPIVNLTNYDTRRYDLKMTIAYEENLFEVQKLLLNVAAKNLLVLADPLSRIEITGFSEHGTNLQLQVWVKRTDLVELQNSLHTAITQAFIEHNIHFGESKTLLLSKN